jgi:hypothetical protein
MGFRLEIGFITYLHLQIVTTSNYNTIANFHTVEITTAHAKSFQSAVFIDRSLVTASNSGDSSAPALTSLLTAPTKSSLQRFPCNTLTTDLQLTNI